MPNKCLTVPAALALMAFSSTVALAQRSSAQRSPIESREYFYVGGKYTGQPPNSVMTGQMYVEVVRPKKVKQKYPLVLFHGASQNATNWMGTPDGRAGWADYFLAQGYVVYMIDQPARGRSAWHASSNGALTIFSAQGAQDRFTAPEGAMLWPQAKMHTQWPGEGPNKGKVGDPIFDAFYATQEEGLASNVETQTLIEAAGSALLDKIGPAIILTHSQSGPFGWVLANSRPKLVKGIVAVEPAGPPFQNEVTGNDKARAWGVADIPLVYDPAASAPSDISVVRQQKPDGTDLVACWEQSGTPRQLVNLKGIPVLIVTAEASYHAPYDHCTAKYLTQAGIKNTHMRLEKEGIYGNGHMVMIEKNNMEIAAALGKWMAASIK